MMTDHVFKRGDIPEEFWDITLTPTIIQIGIIDDLISKKFFNDNTHEFAMAALDALGDTRWLSAEDFIHSLIQLPNMEDFT